MNKYKKTFRLIYAYYMLIVLIGIGQIFWAIKFGWEYNEPDVGGFYMITRLLLAVTVLAFMFLKMRRRLCWTIIIETSMNIFVGTYMIYYLVWHLIRSASENRFAEVLKIVRVSFAWDVALVSISVAILYFMINKWNEIEIQPAATAVSADAPPLAP